MRTATPKIIKRRKNKYIYIFKNHIGDKTQNRNDIASIQTFLNAIYVLNSLILYCITISQSVAYLNYVLPKYFARKFPVKKGRSFFN